MKLADEMLELSKNAKENAYLSGLQDIKNRIRNCAKYGATSLTLSNENPFLYDPLPLGMDLNRIKSDLIFDGFDVQVTEVPDVVIKYEEHTGGFFPNTEMKEKTIFGYRTLTISWSK